MVTWSHQDGLTFIELLIGLLLLIVVLTSVLSVFNGSSTLNEHSRNRAWAMTDASRVMERLRLQNSGTACSAPSVSAPAPFAATDWDGWLATSGGGKSVQPDPTTQELIRVSSSGTDPLTVTVAVCWRHRARVYGECQWTGTQLLIDDRDGNGIISSPAMLSSLLTCRMS